MTNRRELADRLEEAAQDLHPYSMGEIESPSLDCALPAYLNEAARLLREPVAGEVEELRAVRDALLKAGGASPSDGMTRFSYWNLSALNKAFDTALSSLRARLDAEGRGGEA